ncbi:MAG: P1 family peptidase [Acidobacteria bacterium]|nr:P1 family peptidase [Acidobacteriota bacterium]
MKGLTDVAGIAVGHASDFEALTGCTAILCAGGAVGGVDVRGSATGTQELDLLSPGHLTERVHAVVLAGGSAFGLEAAAGVRRFLERKGVGFKTPHGVIPLVPCAILYDLGIGRPDVRPTRAMGEAAAAAASSGAVPEGAVGAGTGATLGKLFGRGRAMKGGIGTCTVTLANGAQVSALVALNAVGDVRDPATGRLIAGARKARDSMELIDSELQMKHGARGGFEPSNTTLAVVATDAALNKVQANKLAQLAQLGLARTIYPVHTMSDGDIVFALSIGRNSASIDALGVAAAEAVAQAVLRAARLSPALGGVPGLAGAR